MNFTQISLLLLSAHVNRNVVYFEINYRNELIYISTHTEIKNNKMLYLTRGIGLLI